MMKRVVAIGLFLLGLALVAAGLWADIQGLIPKWLFVAALVISILCAGLATRLLSRLKDLRKLKADALSAWRHLRAAREVRLISRSTEDCDLVLELVPEWDLNGEPVSLLFFGVSQLVIRQSDGCALHFDYLICEERAAKRGVRVASMSVIGGVR